VLSESALGRILYGRYWTGMATRKEMMS